MIEAPVLLIRTNLTMLTNVSKIILVDGHFDLLSIPS